jgi:acyl carrier protein
MHDDMSIPLARLDTEILSRIRALVIRHGRMSDLDRLADDSDLYEFGLSSLNSVNLMLALEDAFGVEFPERMLRRRTFASIRAIHAAIIELRGLATGNIGAA